MLNNLQLSTLEQFGTGGDVSANARRLAAKSFDRVYSAGRLAQLWSRLNGKSNALKELAQQPEATSRHSTAIQDVPIDQIVGSVSRNLDFDARFNPLKIHDRERWVGVAAARRTGVILPAVELVRRADGYYVSDGHHRISVARASGQLVIEARIVE